MPTPHPNRLYPGGPSTSFSQTNRSIGDSSESSNASPFPPRASVGRTPSPLGALETNTAYTSTPASQQSKSRRSLTAFRSPSKGHERTRSGTEGLGSSTGTGRERWQTPANVSISFEQAPLMANVTDLPELPQPTFDDEELGQEQSVPVDDREDLSSVGVSTFAPVSSDSHIDRRQVVLPGHTGNSSHPPIVQIPRPHQSARQTIRLEHLPADASR